MWKAFESSQNTEEPEQTVEEIEPSTEIIDTASIEPPVEPSQPTSEPEAVEPSEPTMEPSQPISEPGDTAEMGPCGNDQICELTISNPTLLDVIVSNLKKSSFPMLELALCSFITNRFIVDAAQHLFHSYAISIHRQFK